TIARFLSARGRRAAFANNVVSLDADWTFAAMHRCPGIAHDPDLGVGRAGQHAAEPEIRRRIRRANADRAVRPGEGRARQLGRWMLYAFQDQGLAEPALRRRPQRIGRRAAVVAQARSTALSRRTASAISGARVVP